jgi:hypothetical protein
MRDMRGAKLDGASLALSRREGRQVFMVGSEWRVAYSRTNAMSSNVCIHQLTSGQPYTGQTIFENHA